MRRWNQLLWAIVALGFISAGGFGAEGPGIAQRIQGRSFPSVFQAWSPAEIPNNKDPLDAVARHDLVWQSTRALGLAWDAAHEGLGERFTPESIARARQRRAELLRRNPNLILLAEIRYYDAPKSYLPEGHPWWKRDAAGKPAAGWEEGGFLQLDLRNPEFQAHVARQAGAAVACGVADGVMLDWWRDDEDHLALARQVREAIGEEALIVANTNGKPCPRTAPFINGAFFECYYKGTAKDWANYAQWLQWAESNLREPRVNCFETWFKTSRQDLALMRATTCLSLTLSDGYCLFGDPNPLPTPDHRHDWYPFWDRSLGRPAGKGAKQADGSWRREFERGTVVYNPPGNAPVEVEFAAERTSKATGRRLKLHRVAGGDGDLLLK